MLRRNLGLIAVISASLLAVACGSDSDGGSKKTKATGGSGGAGGGGGAAGGAGTAGVAGTPGSPDPMEPGATPPEDPGMPVAAGTEATTIALRKLFLGDRARDGSMSPTAWKDFGYNLDGIISTKSGSNHCNPVQGANPTNVKTDGTDGIDNSFGANLMPIITSVAATASDDINMSLETGQFTILVHMTNLDAQATQAGIDSMLYGGGDFTLTGATDAGPGPSPTWQGTDVWPVAVETVNGGSIDDPKVKFPTAYMVGGTWVSGSQGDITLTISVQGFELALKIRNATISMDLTGTGSSAAATNGIIAGVLNTEELVDGLRQIAGRLDMSLCAGSTFESIAQQIRAASDIMADGSNGDPSKDCDAISVGLGFEGQAVVLGDLADPVPMQPDPCMQ